MTTTTTVHVVQRRVLLVLAGTQVLAGVGVATALAVRTLIAVRLSGSEAVGGVALTCVVLGAAGAALVVSRVASRAGRRPALSLGYGVGRLGGVGAVFAVTAGSAPGLLVALVLVGFSTAAGLAARFAATDLAEPGRRARALALVVWAPTVGAVAGPNLAGPAQAVAWRFGLEPTAGRSRRSSASGIRGGSTRTTALGSTGTRGAENVATATADSYTAVFGGTSAASAIIAGVAVVAQAMYSQAHGQARLGPEELRQILSHPDSGTPQHHPVGAGERIGSMPDLVRVAAAVGAVAR